jgi:hypothetical protein
MAQVQDILAQTDYLNISVPFAESGGLEALILESLKPVFPLARKGSLDLFDIGKYDHQRGTLKLSQMRPVYIVSLSGLALTFIRATGCLPDFLYVFRNRAHRITRLDAALDIKGLEGPSFVVGLHDHLRKKGIRVGQRKAPFDVHFGFDKRNHWTGTVYIGARSGRVRIAIYDKRHEQESRGHPDYGPWTRIEVRVRGGDQGVPVILQDVANPTALFWAHLPPGIVETPPDVPIWEPPDEAIGYKLPPRSPRLPEQDLRRWVQLHGTQAQELADACGPHGRRLLIDMLRLLPNLFDIPF